jgi:hypothetical protein
LLLGENFLFIPRTLRNTQTLSGQNEEFLYVKAVVHIVTVWF